MTATEWNRKYAIGTQVRVPVKGGMVTTRTTAPAWSLSTGRGVVPVQGIKGSVLIEKIEPVAAAKAGTP